MKNSTLNLSTTSFDSKMLKWGALGMVAYLVSAFATLPANAKDGGRRHGPPPEATYACKDKKIDDVCKVTFGGTESRTIDGKCGQSRSGVIACRPDRPHGPQPEMLKACEGKKADDVCQVTFGDKSLAGTCQTGRGYTLNCRPKH